MTPTCKMCWLLLVAVMLCLQACKRCHAISLPGLDSTSNEEVCKQAVWLRPDGQGLTVQAEPFPYIITTDADKYQPGKPVKVTVAGKEKTTFRGLILQARLFGTFTDTLGGLTSSMSDSVSQLYSCEETHDTLVVWRDTPFSNVTASWVPQHSQQFLSVYFMATIYKDNSEVWQNITSPRMKRGASEIDASGCGDTKGCFRYSEESDECSPQECTYMFTYRVEGENAHFELSSQEDWAAIGFSSDNKMGGDDVLVCSKNSAAVQHYWNDYEHQPSRLVSSANPVTDDRVEVMEDGRVTCQFSRPLKVKNDEYSLDLNNDWFQLYAWGSVTDGGTLQRHTLPQPPTSPKKLTLLQKVNLFNASPSLPQPALLALLLLLLVQVMTSNILT